MPDSQTVADLREALAQLGCAVCRLLERDERRFFETFIYEQINDLRRREQLKQARGFCAAHAQAFSRYEGAPMSAAIITRSLLAMLLDDDRLAQAQISRSPLHTLLRRPSAEARSSSLRPRTACPVCAYSNERTRHYLAALLSQPPGSPFAQDYACSDGLCLPHLALALSQAPDASIIQAILEHQRRVWERLRDTLDEFVRKHDYRFQHEALTEEEQRIWRQALLLVSGTRSGRDEPEG